MGMDYILLGQRIRTARLPAGISQEQLAEMADLTNQHIFHTEAASTKISLTYSKSYLMNDVSQIAKLPYDYLKVL